MWGVIVAMASEIACSSASTVRAFNERSFCFTFPQICSMGLKWVDHGDKNRSWALVASMISRTPSTSCAPRLSMTTIWPGSVQQRKTRVPDCGRSSPDEGLPETVSGFAALTTPDLPNVIPGKISPINYNILNSSPLRKCA